MSEETEPAGVGTELKRLLEWFGIYHEPDCACDFHAWVMDQNGPEWCRQHLTLIVGWMREEAARRKMRFLNIGARLLVRLAIYKARKNMTNEEQVAKIRQLRGAPVSVSNRPGPPVYDAMTQQDRVAAAIALRAQPQPKAPPRDFDPQALCDKVLQSIDTLIPTTDHTSRDVVRQRLAICVGCQSLNADGCGDCGNCGNRWDAWQKKAMTGQCGKFVGNQDQHFNSNVSADPQLKVNGMFVYLYECPNQLPGKPATVFRVVARDVIGAITTTEAANPGARISEARMPLPVDGLENTDGREPLFLHQVIYVLDDPAFKRGVRIVARDAKSAATVAMATVPGATVLAVHKPVLVNALDAGIVAGEVQVAPMPSPQVPIGQ